MTIRLALLLPSLCALGCGSDEGGIDPPDASNPPVVDAPAQPDAPSLACSPASPDDCAGETICVTDRCEPAFNRLYRFSTIAVTAAALNPGGSAWDILGGAPDPFVVVTLNDTDIITTGNISDVFTASFTESDEVAIIAGSKLKLRMADADVEGDDLIFECTIDPLTAAALRRATVQCDGSGTTAGSTITLRIEVRG